MIGYVIKRILLIIPTLLAVGVVTFFLLRVVPGDIVELKLRGDGAAVTQLAIERERARLGLDKPLINQFGDWITGVAVLDFGTSMWTGRPVTDEIVGRLTLSFQIAFLATLIGLIIAIPLGTLSALFANTWIDYLIRVVTLAGLSMPSFWLGMLIIIALLHTFNWIPPMTPTSLWRDPMGQLAQLFWPALAVGYRFSAIVARMMRSSLVEVLHEDYIRTARAKGLFERTVIIRHALSNALLPAITVSGLEFAFLIGGLVVTEQVFNLNGIGRLFVQAIINHDYIMIQALIMLTAFVFVATNLVVDLIYAYLDPRIRYV